MATGIAISDKCTEAYAALNKRTYSAVSLKINDTNTEISLEQTFQPEADPEAEWKAVTAAMKEDNSRYVLADFKWKETPTVTKSKVILIQWVGENAPVMHKMVYATSAVIVTTKLPVQKTIQANELEDVTYSAIKKVVAK